MGNIFAKKKLTNSNAIFLGLLLASTITIAGCGNPADQTVNQSAQNSIPSTAPSTVTTNQSAGVVAAAASYKDGTYSATGDYNSPGGPEQIGVTLTLKNNIVTDAQVQSLAFRSMSQRMQGMFVDGFKPFVVGQNINQLHLTKVSGSSLTPMGFNDAVQKIEAQAKA